FRLLPAQILGAAGDDVVSTSARAVPVTYEVRSGGAVLASASLTLGFSPSDGLYSEATPPIAAAVVKAGKGLAVDYDISHVRNLNKPRLVVSSINHWSPAAAPLFRIEASFPLSQTAGTVNV